MALTDWNDLLLQAGKDEVRRQLLAAAASTPANDAGGDPVPELAWTKQLLMNDRGKILPVMANVYLILSNHAQWAGVIGFCAFSYRVMKRLPPPFALAADVGEWSDVDTDRVRLWLGKTYQISVKNTEVLDAVNLVAADNEFHPVRDYLHGLRWDGRIRVRSWLSMYLGASTSPYTEAVGIKWLVGAVARVMRPPVKMDCMLILEGPQGLGKSTVFRILGGPWFMDTNFTMGDKDGFQQLQGVWITEMAELDSLNKADSTRAKQFLGAMTDRYRPSYARLAKDFPRQCVFGGTTNQSEYLRDSTGNRRYWPVEVRTLRLQELLADRDQIWAEAFQMYKDGALWWPSAEELHLFEAAQEDRFDVDVWEEVIGLWLNEPDRRAMNELTAAEIIIGALKVDQGAVDRAKQNRIGPIMKRLGWERGRVMRSGVQQRVYVRPSAQRLSHQQGAKSEKDIPF